AAAPPTGELEKVHTPNCASIDDVCAFMKVKPRHMLKSLVYRGDNRWVLAIVRGDHDVNEGKLKAACGFALALGDEAEARAAGFSIGYVGPHAAVGRDDTLLVL